MELKTKNKERLELATSARENKNYLAGERFHSTWESSFGGSSKAYSSDLTKKNDDASRPSCSGDAH